MPLTVLDLAFDPVLRLGETTSVRWETVGLAIVLFAGLLLAVRIGSLTPADGADDAGPLRIDDFVFMVVGAVPGAIVGGRLGYVLDHLDYYKGYPAAVLDPAQGGFTLTLAVPLGILTGALIARLLGAPVGRWMHAVAPVLLFVLSAGKLVAVLGATGQGAPSNLDWATAYGGSGPWGSLAAEVPSHPSQVYEAILIAIAIPALLVLSRTPALARRDGAMLFAALGLWAAARFVVAFTWRDLAVAGPFRMEQLLALGVGAIATLGLARRARVGREPASAPESTAETPPAGPPDLSADTSVDVEVRPA